MRAALLLPLLLLLPGGCRCESEPEPDEASKGGEATKDPPGPAPSWRSYDVMGLKLFLPPTFEPGADVSPPLHMLFFAPKRDGHRATVLVYWNQWAGSLEEWAEHNRLKWDYPESGVPVVEQGWTTVGGKRAYYLIREEVARVPDLHNEKMPFLLIDWYLVDKGHAGYVRGIALKKNFPLLYRPVFEEVARRVRYRR